MSNRVELISYIVLIVLLIGAAALFAWNVTEVTAGPRQTLGPLELPELGSRSETDFVVGAVPPALNVFQEVNRYDPIATPLPTPTRPPTPTPEPTIPPCAVGWSVSTMSSSIVKIEPKDGRAQFVRLGETYPGTDVMVREIRLRDREVDIECTSSGVVRTLIRTRQ